MFLFLFTFSFCFFWIFTEFFRNVNACALADDVDDVADVEPSTADVPELVAFSDNAVDVGIGDDDDSPVGVNGIALPVDDNCVGN